MQLVYHMYVCDMSVCDFTTVYILFPCFKSYGFTFLPMELAKTQVWLAGLYILLPT